MFAVPTATPYITPVLALIVPTVGVPLPHVPPVVASVNVKVEPTDTFPGLGITIPAGNGLTVTTVVT